MTFFLDLLWQLFLILGALTASEVVTYAQLLPKPSFPSEQIQALWTRRVPGAISNLSLSKNGKAILVATSPDSEIEGSEQHYLLSKFNEKGKLLWQKRVVVPIRELDISADGDFAVFSNYENEIKGLDSLGKEVWEAKGTCKPILVDLKSKRMLCYHDDDAEPQIAYDLFDWNGKKLFSFPIHQDVLSLKLSPDELHLVLALSEGQLILIDQDYQRVIWKKKLEGEIIDIAVSNGEFPQVAVLYKDQEKSQKTVVFDHLGRPIGVFSPSFRASQVEISPQGESVFYYGNTAAGQILGSAPSHSSRESWRVLDEYFTAYSYSILLTPGLVWMGLEFSNLDERQSHVLGFDYKGVLRKDFKLEREKNAYLYTQKASVRAGTLAVGSDDGRLSLFKF